MAIIEYNGSVVATVEGGNTATLPIKDLKMKSDIVVTVPEAASGTDSAIPIEVATEAEMTALLESGEVGGVYKYTGTTGTYENGALYVLEKATITFTIDGTSYQAEDGMTWGQFINSKYNPTTIPRCEVIGLNAVGYAWDEYNTWRVRIPNSSYDALTTDIIKPIEYESYNPSSGGGVN